MPNNREGQLVPEVKFRLREQGEWVDVTTGELFAGKTVVLFALPGAYTPTCSAAHLPRYEALAPAFEARGVDAILCLAVNDGFVMEAWAREQGVNRVRMIADGNGEFSRAMGVLVDRSELGFGPRSRRYSMLVRDGRIEKMFVEPDLPGDPYQVSDADTLLAYLDPEAARGDEVALFTRPGCPHCARAKALLDGQGLRYEEIVIDGALSVRALRAVSGADTVPQIYINGEHIGSADALELRLQRAA